MSFGLEHRFDALSVVVGSEIPVIDLPPCIGALQQRVDIAVRRGRGAPPSYAPGDFSGPDDDLSAGFDEGIFRFRGGNEITVWPTAGHEQTLDMSIAQGGLAWIGRQRGLLVLHASAVALGRRAVIVAGASGAGKSSLAAALVAVAGGRLLCDDVTFVDDSAEGPRRVLPASRSCKLAPAVAEQLGLDAHPGPRWKGKQRVLLPCERAGLELAAVLVVRPPGDSNAADRGVLGTIEQARPSEVFGELMGGPYLIQRFAERHFAGVGDLLASTPLWRARRGSDVAELPALARAVAAHV